MKDYCTAWFDKGLFGSWKDCCCQHDADYSDPCFSRREADKHLYKCVKASGHPISACLMFVGVSLIGWIFKR